MFAKSENKNTPSFKPLHNHLILHKIFVYVPTNLLLSSCSLVNKTWNREARTFVRDYRLCKIRMKENYGVCKNFQALDELCAKMVPGGRIFPVNSLSLEQCFDVHEYHQPEMQARQAEGAPIYKNLSAKLHLKSFRIGPDQCTSFYELGKSNSACPAYKQIMAWVRKDKSHQLQHLEIQVTQSFVNLILHPSNTWPELIHV